MKVIYYNPVDEKGVCVIRSISKALNKSYEEVKKDLLSISDNYNDEVVFENYLLDNSFRIERVFSNKTLKNVSLNDVNVVFGHVGDWYHMVCVIDDVIYDKNGFDELRDMKIIKVYKRKEMKG